MTNEKKKFNNIDEYISLFEGETARRLSRIRQIIREEAPEALEKISYQMPAFYLQGNLVYFAAFTHHIGLYPAPSALKAWEDELKPYRHGKGSIRFPADSTLPEDLIRKIVRTRVNEKRSHQE